MCMCVCVCMCCAGLLLYLTLPSQNNILAVLTTLNQMEGHFVYKEIDWSCLIAQGEIPLWHHETKTAFVVKPPLRAMPPTPFPPHTLPAWFVCCFFLALLYPLGTNTSLCLLHQLHHYLASLPHPSEVSSVQTHHITGKHYTLMCLLLPYPQKFRIRKGGVEAWMLVMCVTIVVRFDVSQRCG